MLRNPAGERNILPIIEVLKKYINENHKSTVIEISSGPGYHISHIAKTFPELTFQPSEYDKEMFTSINEYRRHLKTTDNVREPVFIDISQKLDDWTAAFDERLLKNCENFFDYALNINLMHISPIICSQMLFENVSKLLKSQGILFTYGPYSHHGILEPQSNVDFNESLKRRNSSWGIRDICDLEKFANKNSIHLSEIHELPANNKLLVWKKS